jgi:hypothetical protein
MNKIELSSSHLFALQSRLSQDFLCVGREKVFVVVQKILLSVALLIVSGFIFIVVAPCGLVTSNRKVKAFAAILFCHIKSGIKNCIFSVRGTLHTPTTTQVLQARLADESLKTSCQQLIRES